MGANEVLLAIDAAQGVNPSQGALLAVAALESQRLHAMGDVALSLGKDGYVLEGVLSLYGVHSAVSGAHGIEISANEFYRPTCLLVAAQVQAMHRALTELDESLMPVPSEDGYEDDARLLSSANLRAVARHLETLGFHPSNFRQMNELARRMNALRAFYARAANRSDAIVCLVL